MAAQAAPPGPQPAAPQSAEDRAKDEAKVLKANEIRAQWQTLAKAFSLPAKLPPRNKTHWDYLLQEGAWLAHDVMQERLWKRAAAFQLAHSAAVFDRKLLRPTVTKEPAAWSIQADNKPAKGKGAKLPDAKYGQANGSDPRAGPTVIPPPELPAQLVPGPTMFPVTPDLLPLVVAQLEEEDVMRLARHSEAQDRYQAACEDARRKDPPQLTIEEEDLLLGRRKSRRHRLEDADGAGYEAAMASARARVGHPGMGDGEGAVANKANRKRKARDNQDEEYEPQKMNRLNSQRPPALQQGVMPPGAMPGGMKGNRYPPGPGMKSPQGNKPGMQRLDSVARPGMMPPGAPGRMYGPRNQWMPLDDQVLAALVTEFGTNWYLVADVLKTANAMAGIQRRNDACKQRYYQLLRSQLKVPDGQELSPEMANAPLMTKPAARDCMAAALPVNDQTLHQHKGSVADVFGKLMQRRTMERQQSREMHRMRAQEHPSHQQVQQRMLAATNNAIPNPLQIGVVPLETRNSTSGAMPGAPPGLPPGGGGGGGVPGVNGGAAGLGGRAGSMQPDGLPGGVGPPQGPPGGGGGGGGGGIRLPPGMTKEQALQIIQTTPLQQLKANAQQAHANYQQPGQQNPQNKLAAQQAVALYQMAQQLNGRIQAQQQQQQLQLPGQPGQQLPPAAGPPPGLAPGMGGMPPGNNGAGMPPGGQPQQQQQQQGGANANRLLTVQHVQQLIAAGKVPPHAQQALLSAAQTGTLTYGQAQMVVKNATAQQIQKQQQQAAAGLGPPRPPSLPQLPQMPGSGQQGMWPNQAAHAAAAAAHANQAASQAHAAALAGAGAMPGGGLPGMPQFPNQPPGGQWQPQ